MQAAEAGATFPLPFEIHVTVREAEIEGFRTACAGLGVKPIFLDLHMKSGGVVKDVMTSSVCMGDNSAAMADLKRISDGLKAAGFDVVREKIETVPSHPAALSRKRPDVQMPQGCYFEAHLAVECTDARRELLRILTDGSGAHLSRNAFKALKGDVYVIMVTHRAYEGNLDDFKTEMDKISGLLRKAGFEIGKEIVEFAILDTRTGHDSAWFGAA